MRRFLLLSSLFALAGCGGTTSTACRTGLCEETKTEDARSDSGGGAETISHDAGVLSPVSGCGPREDGTIVREDVPLEAGLRARFRVSRNLRVNLRGAITTDGSRLWDLGGGPSDSLEQVETKAPGTVWFGGAPGATYASKLSSDLWGLFQAGTDALTLLRVASEANSALRTELRYDPSPALLRFPLARKMAWTDRVNVSGTHLGTPVFYQETYESEVDAAGILTTPLGPFSVLRVRTKLTRVALGVPTITRTMAFVARCAGTVATVRSHPGETADEFSEAEEAWRLSP